MKNVLLATAAVLALSAGSAAAVDLGNGLAWDTTVTAAYETKSEDFSLGMESEVNYTLDNGVFIYATAFFDVEDPTFLGSEIGVEYTPPQMSVVTLSAFVELDEDFNDTAATVQAELSF